MISKIQLKRGQEVDLPILNIAEPAFTTDTKKIFIGDGAENIEIAKKSDLDLTNEQMSENTQNISQLSNPNLLINHDFQVWQRGTPITGSYGQYLCDRWISTSTSVTATKTDYGINLVKVQTDGSPIINFRQRIEVSELKKLEGKNLTFSVLAKGNFTICVYDRLNTSVLYGSATSYTNTNGQYNLITLNIPSFTFNANIQYLEFSIIDGSGNLDVNYAKLELGSIATPFVPRLYAEELALCQRYYFRNKWQSMRIANFGSSILTTTSYRYPVRMRVTPTITNLVSQPIDAIRTPDYSTNIIAPTTAQIAPRQSGIINNDMIDFQFDCTLAYADYNVEIKDEAYGFDAEIY